MTNAFDEPDATFSVLVNAQGQHSLWPAFAPVPGGWTAAHGPAGRAECIDYINAHWTDIRPRSLAAQFEATAQRQGEHSHGR